MKAWQIVPVLPSICLLSVIYDNTMVYIVVLAFYYLAYCQFKYFMFERHNTAQCSILAFIIMSSFWDVPSNPCLK